MILEGVMYHIVMDEGVDYVTGDTDWQNPGNEGPREFFQYLKGKTDSIREEGGDERSAHFEGRIRIPGTDKLAILAASCDRQEATPDGPGGYVVHFEIAHDEDDDP